MKKKYIIYLAKYRHNCNGINVMHKLVNDLKQKGYEAYLYAPPSDETAQDIYISEITDEMRENDIVIYTETTIGNPLLFRNVVRYILYYPAIHVKNSQKTFDNYELIYTFLPEFYNSEKIFFIPGIDTKLFYKDDTPKDTECYFVYKGGKWKDVPEFNNMIEINNKYPETREELAKLLRRTKTLYSYDSCSLLLDEALACGCKVKLVTEDGFEDYPEKYDYSSETYEKQLMSFIDDTQKFNYKGKIKPYMFKQRVYWGICSAVYFVCKILFPNKPITDFMYYASKKYAMPNIFAQCKRYIVSLVTGKPFTTFVTSNQKRINKAKKNVKNTKFN